MSSPDLNQWLLMLALLGVASSAVIGLGWAVQRVMSSVQGQTAVWRSVLVAAAALVILELTGVSAGLSQWCRVGDVSADPVGGEVSTPLMTVSSLDTAELPVDEVGVTQLPDDDTAITNSDAIVEVDVGDAALPDDAHAAVTLPVFPRTAITSEAAAVLGDASCWWPGWLWCLGTLLVLARLGWSHVVLRLFLKNCRVVAVPELRQQVEGLAQRLGLSRRVLLLESPKVLGPAALGVLRPAIVLPPHFAREFSVPQQEAIVAHELAHLARNDALWHALATVVCGMLWWNPLIWRARRALRATSEMAADEASLLLADGPQNLADGLLVLGRRLVGCGHIGRRQLNWQAIEGEGFRSSLGQRVERLLRIPEQPWRPTNRPRAMLTMTAFPAIALVLAIGCSAWARVPESVPQGETKMNLLSASWRSSVAATALWTLLGSTPNTMAEELQPFAADETLVAFVDDAARSDEKAEGRKSDDDDEGDDDEDDDEGEGDDDDRKPDDRKPDDRKPDDRKPDDRKPDAPGDESRKEKEREDGRKPNPKEQRQELINVAERLRGRLKELKPDQEEWKDVAGKLKHVESELGRFESGDKPRKGSPERRGEDEPRKKGRPEGESRRGERDFQKGPGELPPEQLERMVKHLHLAAGNLREAGMHDQARMLLDTADRLQGKQEPRREDGRRGPHPEGDKQRTERGDAPQDKLRREGQDGGPHSREGGRPPMRGGPEGGEIQELRAQVRQMREEMQEMRELLKKLVEKKE